MDYLRSSSRPKFFENIKCIDLFCGVGGLTYGLQEEGLKVVAGFDIDLAAKYPFEHNNSAKFILQDVCEVRAEEIKQLFGDAEIRILAGCAPCQPFSTYSHRYKTVGTPRWGLLYQFAKLVRETRPEIVTMENVPSVTNHSVYSDFVYSLKSAGYSVASQVIDCTKYGLPQKRQRAVLIASLLGPMALSEPTTVKPKVVRSAIGDLPALIAGAFDPDDPLHKSASLSALNLQRIRVSKPGGTWRDWPEHLIADCHRKSSGKTYPGVYARMTWDEPSPTLTTQFYGFGNGRFGHPVQDRAISLREGAILQGFPANYQFTISGEPIEMKTVGRLIGNAVPVNLGRLIGRSIKPHLGVTDRQVVSQQLAVR